MLDPEKLSKMKALEQVEFLADRNTQYAGGGSSVLGYSPSGAWSEVGLLDTHPAKSLISSRKPGAQNGGEE